MKTVGTTPPARGEPGASVSRTTRCWCTSWGTGRSAPARPSSTRCISSSTPPLRAPFAAQELTARDSRL